MAVPKRKVSKSRSRMRRANKSLTRGQLYSCPQCDQQIMPHTVCVYCGFYRNSVVMKTHDEDL